MRVTRWIGEIHGFGVVAGDGVDWVKVWYWCFIWTDESYNVEQSTRGGCCGVAGSR